MKSSAKKRLLGISWAVIVCLLWVMAIGLIGSTLVDTALIVALGLGFVIITFPLGWKLLIPKLNKRPTTTEIVVGSLLYAATVMPLGLTLLLGVNDLTATDRSRRTITAEIVGKHTEQRSRYRHAAGRRLLYQGERTLYFVTVAFPDGHTKKLSVNANAYVAARKGRRVDVDMRRGILGFTVVDLPAIHSALSARKR